MIRWKFILTRVLIVAAILTLLRWGLGPAARYLTVQGVEMATGARADIARTEIGLFPPRVHYTDIRVADPRGRKEFHDLFRADLLDLEIDGEALLHRRWVVRNGRISGLEIGARRSESGHLDETGDDEQVVDAGSSLLSQLVAGTMDELGGQASALVDDLETVRRSEQIRRRWESDYASLVSQARELKQQVQEVRDQAVSIKNPLRDYAALDQAISRAQEIRAELSKVRRKIDELPQQVQADLDSLEEAKQIDLAKVEEYVPGGLEGSDQFAGELVANSVRERLDQLRDYLDHGRQIADVTVVPPQQERARGQWIDLSADRQRPQMLIRQCEVSGLLRSRGHVYTLKGVVNNVTPTPERLREPTRARMLLEDVSRISDPIRLDYVRDRRDGDDIDQVTLLWPRSHAQEFEWGCGDKVGISVRGGQREVWAQLVRNGDSIQGRLVSKQTGLQMRLRVAPRYAESPIAESIGERLAEVDRVEIDARFDGTWDDLDLKLESNVERVLREATDQAIAAQLGESRQKIADNVRRTHRQETESLQQWLRTQQAEARTRLTSADRSIEEMFQKVTRGIGSADAVLGRFGPSAPSGRR